MTIVDPTPTTDTADDVAERVFGAVLGAMDTLSIYVGDRLGWYDALAEHGPVTSTQLAERTGSDERYAREWLEQQAATGFVFCDDPHREATERRFRLDDAHREVLTDRDSLAYLRPFGVFVGALARQLDALCDAYRTGGGVGWDAHGDAAREAQAAANRPMFLNLLGREYLPGIPEVHAALEAGGRVADVGTGFGWSAVGIAEAYPTASVDGFDLDAPSIDQARSIAAKRGVDDRVRFECIDAADAPAAGQYDLVTAFECIHDMPDPVGVLATMRQLVKPGGTVIVMDERVGDTFAGPADEVERIFYGFSLLCCLPDGLAHDHSVGTGTVMRHPTFEGYASAAGFSDVSVLDIDNDFFRFYRLTV
ncbi:MAG: class I SAM-dependent methyltransferase [Actinomycetota bacterium]